MFGAQTALVGLLGCALAANASSREDRTTDWYTIEAIVFQRTGTHDSPEQLLRSEERRFPAATQSLTIGAPVGGRLDPPTAAILEFPVLTLNCAVARGPVLHRPATTPARYAPPAGSAAPSPCTSVESATRASEAAMSQTPAREPHGTALGEQRNGTSMPTAASHCPEATFDVPLATPDSVHPCAQPPGKRPPTITPRLAAHPQLDRLDALERFENQLRAGSYQPSLDDAKLRRAANRIRNSASLQLLWHGRWTQPVVEGGKSEPLLVQVGPQINGGHELEGFFAISRRTLLRFHAKLWLNNPAPPVNDTSSGQTSVGLPISHSPMVGTGGPRVDTRTARPGSDRAAADPPPMAEGLHRTRQPTTLGASTTYMLLDERRAMRGGRLHYLDHPAFGVLVRADPVQVPEQLARLIDPAQ